MQISDQIKHIIVNNGIKVDTSIEYSQDQLLSLYASLIQYLNDKLVASSNLVDEGDAEVELDLEEIVQFKQQLSKVLTDQDFSDIVGYYNHDYLSTLDSQSARIICETLIRTFHIRKLTPVQLWKDVLANNGIVPEIE